MNALENLIETSFMNIVPRNAQQFLYDDVRHGEKKTCKRLTSRRLELAASGVAVGLPAPGACRSLNLTL